MEMQPLVNRVAESGLITLDLESLFPKEGSINFDLKNYLFKEIILKENDFREELKNLDWEKYRDKIVAIYCSADAIVPMWAYMLVAVYLQPLARAFYFCNPEELDEKIILDEISKLDLNIFDNQRIIIKGCSNRQLSPAAYVAITRRLGAVARSLMYGEACSNVPLFKRKHNTQ